MLRIAILPTLIFISSVAAAQATSMSAPPSKGKKLTEILAKVKEHDKLKFISEVDWSQTGFYDIYYYTTDNAKVELHIDLMKPQTRQLLEQRACQIQHRTGLSRTTPA